MRFIWVSIHLILSGSILSVPILGYGCFDQDKWLVGRISRFWARWVLWSMSITYEIQGIEHLSYESQYIFVSNHESALDVLL